MAAAPAARIPGPNDARFHIGVMTGTVSQGEDELRAAEELIKRYGSTKTGGMINHITYPDDFPSQQETVISNLVSLTDDPLMKVVVAVQAIPGVSEAFKRIKAKRPDILLLAGAPQEDPQVIQSAADLVVDSDFVARGYTIIWAAKQMGAKTFVHISFPRHMSIETLSRRRAVFEAASKDLGVRFVYETAPDPTSDVGLPGAQQFILEKVPQWLQKYGAGGKQKVAFFCTNDGHTEPLLKQLIASKNGIFVEADVPSPLMGYPGALGLDLSQEAGLPTTEKFQAILKKVEQAVIAKGGAGRFGTWAYSYVFNLLLGLAEFGKDVVEGKAERTNMTDLFKALQRGTPGVKWNGAFYVDSKTGARIRNEVLVYMDTYALGRGNLQTTQQKVPEKYFSIKR